MDFEEDDALVYNQDEKETKELEEDLYLSSNYKSLNDVVIFLVDLQIKDSESFNQIFKTAENFLKTKIITNENDLFGLIFYNCATPSNNLSLDGVNVLINATCSDANLIKKIKHLEQSYKHSPSKEFHSLNNAFWVCQNELKAFDPNFHNRRIFIFTDNDNPILSKEDKIITIQRARDLIENDIVIELFPMNLNNNELFNIKHFFSEIIQIDSKEIDDYHKENYSSGKSVVNDLTTDCSINNINIKEDNKSISNFYSHSPHIINGYLLTNEYSQNRLNMITCNIKSKQIKKRSLGTCDFSLSRELTFKINFYATIKKSNKSKSVPIEGTANKELNFLVQPVCQETNSILYQNQIGEYQPYGKTKVPFDRNDIKKIKCLEQPGISLIGFKSIEKVKCYHNIKSSYFLHPDEELNPGSSQLCDALINQLIIKGKVAIVKFIAREGSLFRICALLPQKEKFDENEFQTPPGFNLVFLPFADEIRTNNNFNELISRDIIDNIESEDPMIKHNRLKEKDLAKRIIKRMTFNFDSHNFQNASIQKFYNHLQALALGEGEESLNDFEDNMIPKQEAYDNLKGADLEFVNYFNTIRSIEYNNMKNEEENENNDNNENTEFNESSKKNNKKTKKSNGNTSSSVKLKFENGINDDILVDLQEEDKLRTLTINQLKQILDERNFKYSVKCKKELLIEKVEDYLSSI